MSLKTVSVTHQSKSAKLKCQLNKVLIIFLKATTARLKSAKLKFGPCFNKSMNKWRAKDSL